MKISKRSKITSSYQKAKKLKEELHNEANHKKFSDELKEH